MTEYGIDGLPLVDPPPEWGWTQEQTDAHRAAVRAEAEAAQAAALAETNHRDRLGSDLALTRLREIRDTADTADTATLRTSIRDLAKWCLEAAKWESQRGAAEG